MIPFVVDHLTDPRRKSITSLPQVAVEVMNTHRLKGLMEIAYVCTQKRSLHDVTVGNAGTDWPARTEPAIYTFPVLNSRLAALKATLCGRFYLSRQKAIQANR